MTSIFGKPTSLYCRLHALPLPSFAHLDVFRQLSPLTLAHGTQYNDAQNLVSTSHLRSIDWSGLLSADPGNVD